VNSIFLSPHNDDETLFGAFTLYAYSPHVIVCLRSQVQEERGYQITYKQREEETKRATSILGCSYEQWEFPDTVVNWEDVKRELKAVRDVQQPDVVFAPAPEFEGHAHHNAVGYLACEVFGNERVKHYLTYTTVGKSTWGTRVPYENAWIGRKLLALACYESQYSHHSCQEHFIREQWEYYA